MQIGSTTPSESHAGPSAYVGGLPGPSSVVTPGSYCQAALVRLICRGLLAAHTHEPGPHRRTGVGFDLMGIAAAGRATPAPRSGFVHGGVQVASGPQGLCAQVYVDECIIVVHSPTLEGTSSTSWRCSWSSAAGRSAARAQNASLGTAASLPEPPPRCRGRVFGPAQVQSIVQWASPTFALPTSESVTCL